MTIEILATEIDLKNGCKHRRYIIFPLDGGKDFCYRSRISYDYFAHGRKRRNWKRDELLYACDHHDGFRRMDDPDAEVVHVDSVWDFYKTIGYDYKKQKWTM